MSSIHTMGSKLKAMNGWASFLMFLCCAFMLYIALQYGNMGLPGHNILKSEYSNKHNKENNNEGASSQDSKRESGRNKDNHLEQLAPGAVHNQAVYYWCGKSRMFEYQHYLSMSSVIRAVRPANIYFYHEQYPKIDKHLYNSWLTELLDDYPFIILINITDPKGCSSSGAARLAVIKSELSRRGGGYYIHENTMVTSKLGELLTIKHVDAMDSTNNTGFLLMREASVVLKQNDTLVVECAHRHTKEPLSGLYCMDIPNNVHPKDIWDAQDVFSQLARWAAYGDVKLERATADYNNLAPNIVHYMWPSWKKRSSMTYTFYLSVLSALYVANVDEVFIHGIEPTGAHWDRIKNITTRVKIVRRVTPTSIYGHEVTGMAHITDVWRLEALRVHGGIYCDADVIIVQPIPRRLRAYDAVVALDWVSGPGWAPELFPNVIQNGVMMGKPGAPFWRDYQRSMRIYRNDQWLWNSCALPYKVIEHHPSYVHLDPHFQINCYEGKCHPIWWPDSTNVKLHHLNTNSIPNWRNATYTFHLTGKVPKGLNNPGEEKGPNTIFTEMAKMILEKAGV